MFEIQATSVGIATFKSSWYYHKRFAKEEFIIIPTSTSKILFPFLSYIPEALWTPLPTFPQEPRCMLLPQLPHLFCHYDSLNLDSWMWLRSLPSLCSCQHNPGLGPESPSLCLCFDFLTSPPNSAWPVQREAWPVYRTQWPSLPPVLDLQATKKSKDGNQGWIWVRKKKSHLYFCLLLNFSIFFDSEIRSKPQWYLCNYDFVWHYYQQKIHICYTYYKILLMPITTWKLIRIWLQIDEKAQILL